MRFPRLTSSPAAAATLVTALMGLIACERQQPVENRPVSGPATTEEPVVVPREPEKVPFSGKCDVTTGIAEIGKKNAERDVTIRNTGVADVNCELVIVIFGTGAPGAGRILAPGAVLTITLKKNQGLVIRCGQRRSDKECKGTYSIK